MNSKYWTALSILILTFYLPAIAEEGGMNNSSVSWIQVAGGLNENAMIMGLTSAADGKVYSGSAGHGSYVTGDNGNTWTKLTMKDNTLDNGFTTAIYAHSGGKIYAGQSSGYVFVSQDNGNSFDTLCRIDAGIQGVVAFAADKENNIYFISSDGDFGIYGPDNIKMKTGKVDSLNTMVRSLTVDYQGWIFIGTMGEGVYISTDKGDTWSKSNDGLPSLDVHKVVARYGVLYAGLSGEGGLYKSYNDGLTWLPSMEGMGSEIVMDIIFCRNLKVVLAATTKDIFISMDNGNNWTSIKNDLPDLTNYRTLALDEDDYLYVGSLVGKIYRTKEPVKIDKGPLSICVEPSSEINVEPGKSTNIVVTISDSENLPVENACILVSDSLNNKQKWIYSDKYGKAEYLLSVNQSCAYGDYLVTFCALEGEYKNSDTVKKIIHVKPDVSAPTDELIRPIELSVRPNPAIDEVIISFESPNSGLAELSLYDLKGDRRAVILRDNIDKGKNNIKWRANGLINGAYFLELKMGGTSASQLIIIDK